MSTITRRSVSRQHRQGRPTLAGTLAFAAANGIQSMLTGRPSTGQSRRKKLSTPRVLIANAQAGPFLIATFAHPTKRTTKGRIAYLTWRKPETPIEAV